MELRSSAAGLILLAELLGPAAARAELYRCVGPDGSVSFTDNPAVCGDARVHEPADVIQRVPASPAPAALRPSASDTALREQAEADAERSWREKRRQSEQELAALAARRDRLEGYALWCNRGGELYRKDDAGLERKVACGQVNRDLDALEERIAALDAYLEEGLAEECRRAGCLPGWVR